MPEETSVYMDNYLAHYGVVGMKWGKRSGGYTQRVQGALSDKAARKESRLTTASKRFEKPTTKKGTAKNIVLYGNFGVGPGRKLVEKMVNKKLDKVKNDRARIDAGKLKVSEKMGFGVSTAGFVVSRRPKGM